MNASSRLHRPSATPTWFEPYLKHLPLLGLSVLFFLLTLYLLGSFSPSELQIEFLPNVYLPLQITSFLTLFFLASFLTLNTHRGYLVACLGQALMFLRLQRVDLTTEVVLSLIGVFVIIELLILIIQFTSGHANFSQKPHHRSRNRHS